MDSSEDGLQGKSMTKLRYSSDVTKYGLLRPTYSTFHLGSILLSCQLLGS